MMNITAARFVLTAVKPDQYPEHHLPEIAMVGRSNVGKSSLINRLARRKHLARTSGTPGKTRTINFFILNEQFYLVDLPGYGFARVSKDLKKDWSNMIDTYLSSRSNLLSTVLLVDIRHKPSAEDVDMFRWLSATQERVIIACTKADKISRGRWLTHMKIVRQTLGTRPGDLVVPCSSESPEGVEPVLEALEELLSSGQKPEESVEE